MKRLTELLCLLIDICQAFEYASGQANILALNTAGRGRGGAHGRTGVRFRLLVGRVAQPQGSAEVAITVDLIGHVRVVGRLEV